MRNDLTEIVLVVDRSGSMSTIQDDAEGGINSFIKEQTEAKGHATLTICQFDTVYEFVCKGIDIKQAKPYKLTPRGGTALNDAIGRAMAETGERLAAMKEEHRPGLVIFMIVTDGHENSSREFDGSKIKEMITHQRENYKWQFVFLGTQEDAIGVGHSYNISSSSKLGKGKMGDGYEVTSSKLSNLRGQVFEMGSLAIYEDSMDYSAEEVKELSEDK